MNKVGTLIGSKRKSLAVEPGMKNMCIIGKGLEDVIDLVDEIERITPNLKSLQASISFKSWTKHGNKTMDFKFKSVEELVIFCMVCALISPHTIPNSILVPTVDTLISFDVLMIHGTMNKKRQLVINITDSTIGRRKDSKSEISKILPINGDTRCTLYTDDHKRLTVTFYSKNKTIINVYSLLFLSQVSLLQFVFRMLI